MFVAPLPSALTQGREEFTLVNMNELDSKEGRKKEKKRKERERR